MTVQKRSVATSYTIGRSQHDWLPQQQLLVSYFFGSFYPWLPGIQFKRNSLCETCSLQFYHRFRSLQIYGMRSYNIAQTWFALLQTYTMNYCMVAWCRNSLLYAVCGNWTAVSGVASVWSTLQPLAVVNENERERDVWLESSWLFVWHHSLVGGRSVETRLSADGSLLSNCQLLPTSWWMLCTDLCWLVNRRPQGHNTCQKLRTESNHNFVFTAWCYAERGYATACRHACLSVCDVQVQWSRRLEYFEIISRPISLQFVLGLTLIWAIWSNGKLETPTKLGWNRGGVMSAKTCNISGTVLGAR